MYTVRPVKFRKYSYGDTQLYPCFITSEKPTSGSGGYIRHSSIPLIHVAWSQLLQKYGFLLTISIILSCRLASLSRTPSSSANGSPRSRPTKSNQKPGLSTDCPSSLQLTTFRREFLYRATNTSHLFAISLPEHLNDFPISIHRTSLSRIFECSGCFLMNRYGLIAINSTKRGRSVSSFQTSSSSGFTLASILILTTSLSYQRS